MILGASNLTLGFNESLLWARRRVARDFAERHYCSPVPPPPVDFYVCAGVGRGFVHRASLPRQARVLPPIDSCQLWAELEAKAASSSSEDGWNGEQLTALIMDVGNDLGYGREPEEVLESLAVIVGKLRSLERRFERVEVRLVDVAPLDQESVPRWKFGIFRRLLFPTKHIGYDDTFRRLQGLRSGLREVDGLDVVVPQERSWFGFDPVHVKPKYRHDAFQRFWGCDEASLLDDLAEVTRDRVTRIEVETHARSHERWGAPTDVPQPWRFFEDSSRLSQF